MDDKSKSVRFSLIVLALASIIFGIALGLLWLTWRAEMPKPQVSRPSLITMPNARRILSGMSTPEVVKLLGPPRIETDKLPDYPVYVGTGPRFNEPAAYCLTWRSEECWIDVGFSKYDRVLFADFADTFCPPIPQPTFWQWLRSKLHW
jgi:hypothetical protein